MGKQLDKTITTLGNMRHATRDLKDDIQMYIQPNDLHGDASALTEITEVQLVLPKEEDEEPYLVLRCM